MPTPKTGAWGDAAGTTRPVCLGFSRPRAGRQSPSLRLAGVGTS
jgi:hypothetical protein